MQDARSRRHGCAQECRDPPRSRRPASGLILAAATIAAVVGTLVACGGSDDDDDNAALVAQGKQIFRFDTFGDEAKWTDTLRMHEVISAAVDPVTALSVGLKVDAEALPPAVVQGIQNGSIDLQSPATTIALLKLDAVVGLKGTVETTASGDVLTRVGITCALCHSTVDNSFSPGIGKRLDGWPNRDLNPGAITGDGMDLAYWNRYVAVTQMGGWGSFSEPRLGLNVTNGSVDLVTSKLPALQAYQLSIAAPAAPAGSFDPAAAARGQQLFAGAGGCATCHSGTLLTDANNMLHPPADSMAEPETPSYASCSASKLYRTSPLKGLWQHAPYFHDGSAATLEDVVATNNTRRSLGLTVQQSADLVQYLKSL